MDYTVHGILQARTLEWVVVPFFRSFPNPEIEPRSLALQVDSLPAELLGKPTKDGWALKNWCFQTVELVKTLQSPLDSKEIKLVNPKGNQPWIFIGRTDIEDDAPILRPPVAKSWLIGKDPDAGKDWGQEQKGAIEGAMVGWHHRLDGHEFEQAQTCSSLSKLILPIVKDGKAWCAAIHSATESLPWLSNSNCSPGCSSEPMG